MRNDLPGVVSQNRIEPALGFDDHTFALSFFRKHAQGHTIYRLVFPLFTFYSVSVYHSAVKLQAAVFLTVRGTYVILKLGRDLTLHILWYSGMLWCFGYS